MVRGRARSGGRRFTEVGEDVAHGGDIGDEGEDAHRAPVDGEHERESVARDNSCANELRS